MTDVPPAAMAAGDPAPAPAGSGSSPADTGRDDLPDVARLLSLSDGVVAIALTLLVLQLAVPSKLSHPDNAGTLWHHLVYKDHGDQFISYLISFYVIAQFWLAHHRVFRHVAGHEEGLAWWNFAFLFTITIMPFTSNLLGDYASNPLAVDIFAVNLLLASLATQAVGIYGRRRGLLVAGTTTESMEAGRVRSLAVVAAVSLSVGLAWVSTDIAKYCWLLIAAAPWAASRWTARRARRSAPDLSLGSGAATGG
jgi:uncharacterized membrane protein